MSIAGYSCRAIKHHKQQQLHVVQKASLAVHRHSELFAVGTLTHDAFRTTTTIIIIIIFVYYNAVKPRNHTVPTCATQGGKQQPPRRAALCTEGLSAQRCPPAQTLLKCTKCKNIPINARTCNTFAFFLFSSLVLLCVSKFALVYA